MRYGWEYTKTLYCLESHSVFKGGQTYIVSTEDDISYFVMIYGKEHSVSRDTEMFEVDEILNSEVQHDRLVNKLNHPLIVGCNYRYTTQRYKNAHFMLVDINFSSGKARLVTRTTNKDFWIDVDRLIYLYNENNQRKAQRIKTDGADYLKTLIGYKHAENWLKRQEAMA